MRRPAFAALALALAGTFAIAAATPADAQTRYRRDRTVVTITPSYLTAGTQASPGEYRGALPEVDARFRTVAYQLPGVTTGFYGWSEPNYLPYPHSTVAIDTGFGSRLPGER